MVVKNVSYLVMYNVETDSTITNGETYKCVSESYYNDRLLSIGVIDDTNEEYQYSPEVFDKIS